MHSRELNVDFNQYHVIVRLCVLFWVAYLEVDLEKLSKLINLKWAQLRLIFWGILHVYPVSDTCSGYNDLCSLLNEANLNVEYWACSSSLVVSRYRLFIQWCIYSLQHAPPPTCKKNVWYWQLVELVLIHLYKTAVGNELSWNALIIAFQF